MHQVNIANLQGKSYGEEDKVIKNSDNPFNPWDWCSCIGNLMDGAPATQCAVAEASYSIFALSRGYPIYHNLPLKFSPQLDERAINGSNVYDFTFHAFKAFAYHDPNPVGWFRERTRPVEFNRQKALEFWDWWLSTALPEAYRVDKDFINWNDFAKDKYQNLFTKSFLSN